MGLVGSEARHRPVQRADRTPGTGSVFMWDDRSSRLKKQEPTAPPPRSDGRSEGSLKTTSNHLNVVCIVVPIKKKSFIIGSQLPM